jgi:hypothetical protein
MAEPQAVDEQYQHIGLIPIDAAMIHHLLQLPDGWRVIGLAHDPMRNAVNVFVQHESIPSAGPGERLHEVTPVYQQEWDEEGQKSGVRVVNMLVS